MAKYYLEVEINDESSKYVLEGINKAISNQSEFIPGLKINKLINDNHTIVDENIINKFKEFYTNSINLLNKLSEDILTNTNTNSPAAISLNQPISNCKGNCDICHDKCIYRNKNHIKSELKSSVNKNENTKPYNGDWVNIEDKNAMEQFFGTYRL